MSDDEATIDAETMAAAERVILFLRRCKHTDTELAVRDLLQNAPQPKLEGFKAGIARAIAKSQTKIKLS